jgi:hypothetical protein
MPFDPKTGDYIVVPTSGMSEEDIYAEGLQAMASQVPQVQAYNPSEGMTQSLSYFDDQITSTQNQLLSARNAMTQPIQSSRNDSSGLALSLASALPMLLGAFGGDMQAGGAATAVTAQGALQILANEQAKKDQEELYIRRAQEAEVGSLARNLDTLQLSRAKIPAEYGKVQLKHDYKMSEIGIKENAADERAQNLQANNAQLNAQKYAYDVSLEKEKAALRPFVNNKDLEPNLNNFDISKLPDSAKVQIADTLSTLKTALAANKDLKKFQETYNSMSIKDRAEYNLRRSVLFQNALGVYRKPGAAITENEEKATNNIIPWGIGDKGETLAEHARDQLSGAAQIKLDNFDSAITQQAKYKLEGISTAYGAKLNIDDLIPSLDPEVSSPESISGNAKSFLDDLKNKK